jgi:pimeloyl-ACP methyl ester carboxylesterase
MRAELSEIYHSSSHEGKEDHYVHSISLGDGQPVILIHGMAASLCDWNSLAPALASHGFAAYALDLLGHGESAKPDDPRAYHIEAIYRHFKTWLESLNLEASLVLVGHSLGGYLSLLHAIRHPEAVRGLVLIDPYYESLQLSPLLRLARRRPNLGERAIRLMPEWLVHTVIGWDPDATAYFSPETRRQIAADYKRASPNFIYITRDMPDLTERLSEVKAPALVIWGERDQTLRPESFQRLVRILPNATEYLVRATGHQPHISQPELVARLTIEFLAQWDAPGNPDQSPSKQFDGDRMNRS